MKLSTCVARSQLVGLLLVGLLAGCASIPEGVTVQRDIAYGEAAEQRFDLYYRPPLHNAPILFAVHGGAWWLGDKANSDFVINKVSHWVPRGGIVISANYRMLPEAEPMQQAQDVAQAIAAVKRRALEWGGDPAALVLMGHSSGAHLLTLVATRPELAEQAGPVLGLVSLDSGGYDIAEIMRNEPIWIYRHAFARKPELWEALSPINFVSERMPPVLAVCSGVWPIPCDQSRRFVELARERGVRAELLPVAMNHKQVNDLLGVDPDYTAVVDRFLQSLHPGF